MKSFKAILLLIFVFGWIGPSRIADQVHRGVAFAGLSEEPDAEKKEEKKESSAPKGKPTLKQQATEFDLFLKSKLSAERHFKLKRECDHHPEQNPFCFSIVNYPYFEEKYQAQKRSKRRGKRIKRVYAKYRKGKLQNWNALRMAPVAATISPMAGLRKARFARIKTRTFEEKQCPLNIAISIAAALEDELPKKQSNVAEIARLYEKGGDCLPDEAPDDKASILTRAGLFFLLDRKPERAYETFARAANIPGAVNSRPLYWLHRAEKALGRTRDAEKSLKTLSEKYPFSFHTVVAQAAINADPGKLLSQPHRDARRSQQVPAINLLIEQVEILHRYDFDESARTILEWAVLESDGVEPEVKIYLAELKDHDGNNDHLRKIKLLSDVLYDNPKLISKKSMELYFPKPYFPIFEKHSSGLDPFLLLAIARQESAFNPRAVSPANAVGLLQVVPRTGRRVTNASRKALMKPEMNIKTGAKYFQRLLKRTNGQIHLAMAAYNAGPTKLKTWLKRYQTDDPILFIDVLPYRETRNYVALVLRNYYWYRRMHGSDSDAKEISRRVFELTQGTRQ